MSPAGQTVTASELVRHFGEWQRRAAQAPVYVLHHRKPEFVLASIELMQTWSAQSQASDPAAVARILDAVPDPIMIVDTTGRILAASRGAWLFFGENARIDGKLSDILSAEATSFLTNIVARVASAGLAEQTELPAERTRARLELKIEPHPAGALIAGRSADLADARDAAQAQAQALATALAALPDTAFATIGPRGYLIAPDNSLVKLTGFSTSVLATARIPSLFSMGSRVAVGDAIEAAFNNGAPSHVEGELLTEKRDPLPVSIGLAPLRRGLTTSAILAVIRKRG